MSKQNEFLEARDEFFKLLPVVPIWLTFLGAIKIFTEYNMYNINIFQYLDLQETLTLFINDLIFFFITTNAGIFLVSYVGDDFKSRFKIGALNIPKWQKVVLEIVYSMIPILLISQLVFLISDRTYLRFYQSQSWKDWAFGGSSIIAFQFFVSTCGRVFDYLESNISYHTYLVYRYYTFFLLFTTFATYTIVLRQYTFSTRNDLLLGSISLNDRVIEFDTKHILIGKTKNFLFVFTPEDGCTEVIPSTSVSQTFIKKL